MTRALGVALLLLACTLTTLARADENEHRLRALALRDAEQRWGACSRQSEEPDGETSVQLVVLGPGYGLAVVETPCHRETSGAYNYASSVVVIRAGRVALAPFGPPPAWCAADGCPEGMGEALQWNARLRREGRDVILATGLLERGLGDSGSEAHYRWRGARFELVEVRFRDGGGAFVDDIGPFPIVGPPGRQCRPMLEVVDAAARRARLAAMHGRTRSTVELTLLDARCTGSGDHLQCGAGDVSEREVSYTVVSRGSDWVVLRVAGDESREVVRLPRGCAL